MAKNVAFTLTLLIGIFGTSASAKDFRGGRPMSTIEATVISVSDAGELSAALASAKGGETIVLSSGGDYGNLKLMNRAFESPVVITSADPDAMASISSVYLNGVKNLTFDAVTFDYESENGTTAVHATGCTNIAITNSIFDGDLGDANSGVYQGAPVGSALKVLFSDGIVFQNNEVQQFGTGATFITSKNIVASDNTVHEIRTDGYVFTGVNDVTIERNHFYDFRSVAGIGEHIDMIQFFTRTQNGPTSDIVIRSNFFDRGDGNYTQSLFMRNEAVDTGAGEEMLYRNILIEDNIIYNSHSHGITVGQTIGITIQNNTVLASKGADGSFFAAPAISVAAASQDVTIVDNVAGKINASSNSVVENNLIVQRESASGDGFYNNVFVNALADAGATVTDLQGVPGGAIAQKGVGASEATFALYSQAPLAGYIQASAGKGLDRQTVTLNAQEFVDGDPVSVVWDFGNGASATGTTVSQAYSTPGTYDVAANLTFADGRVTTVEKRIVVESAVAANLTFDSPTTLAGTGALEIGRTGSAVRLSDEGRVDYTPLFVNNSEYTAFMDFKADAGAGSTGSTLLALQGSFGIKLLSTGLDVTFRTDLGGSQRLRISDSTVNDGDWHRVGVSFSGEAGTAILYLDGKEIGRFDGLEGAVQIGSPGHHLYYGGTPWESNTFTGLVDNVAFVRAAMEPEQIEAWNREPTPTPTPTPTNPIPSERGDLNDGRLDESTENWARETTKHDVANAYKWSTDTRFHDELGRLGKQITIADNGEKTLSAFDIEDVFAWDRKDIHIDVNNVERWTEYTRYFDEDRKLLEETGTYDDGRSWRSVWDVEGTQDWHRQTTVTDAAEQFDWHTKVTDFDENNKIIGVHSFNDPFV